MAVSSRAVSNVAAEDGPLRDCVPRARGAALFSLFRPNDFSATAGPCLVERNEGWQCDVELHPHRASEGRKGDPGPEIALRHRLAAVDAQPSWVAEQS